MNKKVTLSLIFISLCCFFMPLFTTSSWAVSDRMNYQGKLTDSGGVPLDGSYIMRFNLFDAESGGSQLWNAPDGEIHKPVIVTGGIYNIELGSIEPLSSKIFSLDDVWLEVSIYNEDTSSWETLIPRQRVTSTAYSFQSAQAADADTLEGMTSADFALVNHDHDADYVNEGQSNSITSAMIVNGSILASDLADGTALAEILDDDGTGSTLDADFLDGYSAGSFTLLSQDYGRYKIATDLYEGATTLSDKYVNEGQANSVTGSMILDSTITAADLAADSVYASEIAANAVGASEIAANAVGTSEINFPLDYIGSDANGGLVAMTNTAAGSVSNYPAALYGGTNGAAGSYNVFGVLGTAPALGTANEAMLLLPYAPIAVGGAAQDGYGVVGTSTSHYHAGVYAEATRGYGLYARHTDPSYTAPAVYGKNEGSGIGVLGDSASGTNAGVMGRTTSSTGIGVRGQGAISTNYGELGKNGIGVEAQGSLYAGKFLGDVIVYYGANLVAQMDVNDYSLHMYDSTGTQTIELDSDYNGNGRVITQELQITGGSDLSEQFDVNSLDFKIQPGMVVSIDPDKPGKLTISSEPYDNKVAGIISGAGGIKTGMMMGQKGTEADGAHPIALTGRVYCYVDTANGPVEPGDLLTTSATPGYAMKVTDHSKAQGAIIGKAMTPLKEGQGLVLALVTLQ
ncbi:MAG: hypothetical protein KKA54_01850 [Proteobacteria bacterium]|nr:hypothetical protein [Pseudomonadota bacterium]MBU0965099.1 hypothetical protein [Pseudomonadota bacterium]